MQKVYLAWTHATRRITEKKPLRVTALFFVLLASVTVYISIYAGSAQAAANTNINFQARVLSNTGAVVGDGFYSVEFNLYTQSAGGTTQWTETQVVTSKNGYITVSLGSVTPFGAGIDWSQEQWLSMNINGDGEMNPRMKVTAVPLAFRANQADTLTTPTGTVSSSQLAQLSPGLVQSTNSTGAALRINQTGSGGLLQLQSGGSDVLTLSNAGDLTVARGLTVGNSTNTVAGTIRWTGTAFEGYNGSAWASLGSSGGAGSLVNIVKPANETVNNSNALQNDDNLTFPIGANEEYTFRFVIQANSGTTPDLRFAVTAPAGATCRVSYADHEGATSNGQYACGATTASIPGNGTVDLYEITGSVVNGATPGSVTLQWAQFTANASNTTVYAGSYVQAIRSIGAGSSGQVFVQNGNAFGETAVLGTSDNNNLALVTNGIERLTVSTNGNIGIGDTTPVALFTVGTGDAFQVEAGGNVLTSGTLTVGGLTTVSSSLVANGSATGTTGATSGTGTNTTTLTLAADSFNVNDVVFIDNAGQDYYTRITADPGTGTYTVSPTVTFENGRTVTKYNIQNIGATASDYSSQANRFFQGYFLGGLVVGAGSTTISDGNINSTTTLRLQENGGDVSLGGALSVSGAISGDGSGLTNINGANITNSSIADASLSSNVTLLGNAFNGNNQLLQLNASGLVDDSLLSTNITKAGNTFNGANGLVQLDGSGNLPALNGSALTSLNATNIASGTLADGRLSSNVTLLGNTFNGANQLVQLDGAGKIADSLLSTNITAAGNTFNGNNQLVQLTGTGALPALNASALTSLDGTNISSGTVADVRLSSNVTLLGNTFNGASQLVQLDGAGYLPVLNGSALTNLNASNLSSGTIADARLSANVTTLGNAFNGNNQLLQLNASGLVDDSLLSTNITKAGNTFNGANGLVQLDGSGNLPALNGSALTSLNATNIASGTLADGRLSSNVTLLGNTFNGANGLVQLDGSGNLPALNGSALTNLNASNIASGTLSDSRLSTNVTLLGNTFNGANQLVQLESSGVLPTLSGTNLTGLSAGNISSGTLDDGRLSSNVGLTNSSQTYSAQQTFAANILLGTDTSTPTAGTLALNDSVASNGFTSVLGTSSLTANRTINLPDESGTVCLSGSANCGFIILAPGSAQADSSTNNMLYLNKTGASGDILNLQKNGTSILRMLNSGALLMTLTSTTAFTIENAGGTDFFNVDTSGGLVRIGGAAADATGVLLVLDTKNTAGDPTGTNGGMYYNSVDNKNRCYENGTWSDCSTMTLAGETTLATANGTINVTLNGNYEYLECRVDIVSRSAASIPYLRFNNNTGAASYGWNSYGIVAAATTDWQDASDSEIQLTGTQTGTNIISADMKITNISGANKVVDWTSAGVEAVGTNSNRYSGVGGFYNSAQVTSMQIVASTGTFAAGSHAWCQGKNVR